MHSPTEQYREALRDRRQGIMSHFDGTATWPETKADFYADSRVLSEDALIAFEAFKEQYPPYGLVTHKGESYTGDGDHPWRQLVSALRATGRLAVEKALPSLTSCPYHALLEEKLGTLPPALTPFDNNEHGLDTLRNVVAPGAILNGSLFASLVLRMPGLQKLHGSKVANEEFARNSVTLLREPLAHPQQHAEAFVYSLGSLGEFLTANFLGDELAQAYTKIEETPSQSERLAWAIPTHDFTLRQDAWVQDRTQGSERDTSDAHRTRYPIGTHLRDIAVTEPTFGCPGNKLANAMWQRTIDVAVGQELWSRVPLTRRDN